MSLTASQLTTFYTNANMGITPSAAEAVVIQAYAQQSAAGALTDQQALSNILAMSRDKTDVAVATYQFFTGSTPTLAGLSYLVHGGGNPTDLSSAYYANFNTENRYYNFAINLAFGNPTASANFASTYGSMTFAQAVSAAYESIIGSSVAKAAGIDPVAAVASIQASQSFFAQVAAQRAGGVNADLATKAIMIGYILEEGIKADVGLYAKSLDGFMASLAQTDTAVTGNLLANYASGNFVLTTGADNFVATGNGANVFTGTLDNNAGTALATATFAANDTVTGFGTNNSLNLSDSSATGQDAFPGGGNVTNIQHITLTTAGNATAFDVSGVTGLTSLNVTSSGTGNDVISAGAAVNVTETAKKAATVTINGGNAVTVTAQGAVTSAGAAGSVNITNGAGAVSVTGAKADVTVNTDGAVTATGGTSLTVNAIGGIAAATRTFDLATQTAAGAAQAAANTASTKATAVVTNLNTVKTAIEAGGATDASVQAATTAAVTAKALTATQKTAIDTAFHTGLVSSGGQAAAAAGGDAVLVPILTAANTTAASAAATLATATTAKLAADAVVTADTAAAAVVAAVGVTYNSTGLTSVSIKDNYSAVSSVTDTAATLTSATLANAGAITLSGAALANVTVVDGQHNVGITGAATQNLSLTNVTAGAISSNATTLNITANGSAPDAIALIDPGATTVKVGGGAGLILDPAASNLNANVKIDASQSTGPNTLTLTNAGQSYVGGSGQSTVTINSVAAQTGTVDGGTGASNKLILNNGGLFAAAGAAKFLHFQALQANTGVIVDVSQFTKSAISSVVLNAAWAGGAAPVTTAEADGLTAAQAGNVQVASSGGYTIGVAGATNPGQLDTVGLTVNSGSASSIELASLNMAGVETLNLHLTSSVVVDTLIGATALTNINLDGAGTASITTGAITLNVNTVVDAHAETGGLTFNAFGALGNGLKIIGSATGANTLTSNGLASVLVGGNGGDNLTGGAGNDVISAGDGNNVVNGGGGIDTVTLGNGNNTVTNVTGSVTAGNGNNTLTVGGGAVTVGNGTNGITDTGTAGAHTITVGSGANTLVLGSATGNGTGVFTVNEGAHTGTIHDSITIGTVGTATVPNLIVTGAGAGDTITFAGDALATGATSVAAGATLAATLTALQNAATLAAAAHGVVYAQFAGNTYVAESNGAAFDATHGSLIELVGVHTFGTTAGVLTLLS